MKQPAGLVPSVLLAALCLTSHAPGQEQEEVLTNADIIALTEAGVPAEAIVIKIESTQSDFDTTVEQLIALSTAGVDASVVAAMTRKAATEAPRPEPPPAEPAAPPQAVPAPQPTAAAPRQEEPQPSGAAEPAAPRVSVTPSARAAPFQPGSTFVDALASGGSGPEMVVIPAGRFRMGCVTRSGCFRDERPVHRVFFDDPIAVSRYAITFEDYDRFAGANRPGDEGWGRGRRPVINVSWEQAVRYAQWLSRETGESYRLLSEAEWEYAARAGSERKYHFGNDSTQLCQYANHADADTDYEWRNRYCSDGVGKKTAVVGSYAPNAFGLYDMHGNAWEWVQDCWNDHYRRAPRDGAARLEGDCSMRVLRGGAFGYEPGSLRAAFRTAIPRGTRSNDIGFRVARTLTP
ncbi:MAG: formylglycine-generating enzyme family protein [Gammaproteobacteria bacterium]|nr:formylglycine-generating enzyme family protein [Gammaproteobacteria bacterium]